MGVSYIAGGACLLVTIIAFGIYEAVTYSHGTSYSTSDCPTFPSNLTYYTATKDILSQYHWTYNFDQFSGSIYQKCPTINHDAKVELGGNVVALSDGKTFTTVSTNYIRDCKGNVLYKCRTGSTFDTIINQNKIQVSFELRDASGNNILAYVDGTHFFTDDIEMHDANTGNVVAKMYRNTLSIHWKWEFTIYNQSHPASDPRVLTLLAGKKAFSDDDNNTDICNQMFWTIAYIFLAIGIILFCVLCVLFYLFFETIKEWCQTFDCRKSNEPREKIIDSSQEVQTVQFHTTHQSDNIIV